MKVHLERLITSGAIVAIEADNSSMVEAIETKAGLRFPPLFRSLLMAYEFQPFILGGIEFFGTTESEDGGHIATSPFRDPCLSPALLQAKLLQVGRPDSGSYDPICFNLGKGAEEPELVQVDHESVLSFDKLRITRIVAPSFQALIEAMSANHSLQADVP